MSEPAVAPEEIRDLHQRLKREAEDFGYHLNPDLELTSDLVRGLLINERRYGYRACPCRLASGVKSEDLDIICPCDYRDADLSDFGQCYCGLYVSEEVLKGEKKVASIPERRQVVGKALEKARVVASVPLPVWRCRVCGYLCARESPPGVCPICKATKERFERFL